jgi:hypothetical protein
MELLRGEQISYILIFPLHASPQKTATTLNTFVLFVPYLLTLRIFPSRPDKSQRGEHETRWCQWLLVAWRGSISAALKMGATRMRMDEDASLRWKKQC